MDFEVPGFTPSEDWKDRSDTEARATKMQRLGMSDEVIKAYFAQADKVGLENMPSIAEFMGMQRKLN